jgi:hypothetical protein
MKIGNEELRLNHYGITISGICIQDRQLISYRAVRVRRLAQRQRAQSGRTLEASIPGLSFLLGVAGGSLHSRENTVRCTGVPFFASKLN